MAYRVSSISNSSILTTKFVLFCGLFAMSLARMDALVGVMGEIVSMCPAPVSWLSVPARAAVGLAGTPVGLARLFDGVRD